MHVHEQNCYLNRNIWCSLKELHAKYQIFPWFEKTSSLFRCIILQSKILHCKSPTGKLLIIKNRCYSWRRHPFLSCLLASCGITFVISTSRAHLLATVCLYCFGNHFSLKYLLKINFLFGDTVYRLGDFPAAVQFNRFPCQCSKFALLVLSLIEPAYRIATVYVTIDG